MVSLSCNISQLSSLQLIDTVSFYQSRATEDEEDTPEVFNFADSKPHLFECHPRRKVGTNEGLDDVRSPLVSLSCNISQLSSLQLIRTVPFYQSRLAFRRKEKLFDDDDEEDAPGWFNFCDSCRCYECRPRKNHSTRADLDNDRSPSVSPSCNISQLSSLQLIQIVSFYQSRLAFRRKKPLLDDDKDDDLAWFNFADSCYFFELMLTHEKKRRLFCRS